MFRGFHLINTVPRFSHRLFTEAARKPGVPGLAEATSVFPEFSEAFKKNAARRGLWQGSVEDSKGRTPVEEQPRRPGLGKRN